MVSTVLPAENGHSAGGMLSATYKSGTNRLHFEGEDRYVNNAMLHRAYFNLGSQCAVQLSRTGQLWSAGRSYIPKLYDGRNKTFFLFGWSRHHEKYNQSGLRRRAHAGDVEWRLHLRRLGLSDLRSRLHHTG